MHCGFSSDHNRLLFRGIIPGMISEDLSLEALPPQRTAKSPITHTHRYSSKNQHAYTTPTKIYKNSLRLTLNRRTARCSSTTSVCRNYNGCKDRNRQIADKPGCAKKNQGHCNCCHNRHCLCLSFILLIHRCSGYTSRSPDSTLHMPPRYFPSRRQKDFLILIDLISVLHCEIIL